MNKSEIGKMSIGYSDFAAIILIAIVASACLSSLGTSAWTSARSHVVEKLETHYMNGTITRVESSLQNRDDVEGSLKEAPMFKYSYVIELSDGTTVSYYRGGYYGVLFQKFFVDDKVIVVFENDKLVDVKFTGER